MNCNFWSLGLPFVVLVIQASVAQGAQPDAGGADKESVKRWMDYYTRVAQEYDIRLNDRPDIKLKVSSEALHGYVYASHHNKVHGAFFVWTNHGRPEAIGAIWSQLVNDSQRVVAHDLHSLSMSPFTAEWNNKVKWTPRDPGIRLEQVPDAKPPAQSSDVRLAQMRAISRRFNGSAFREQKQPLRVQPQPLYRYDLSQSEIIDGAIFTLFHEWDPEMLLLIEARKQGDRPEWYFAPVPFSNAQLTLEYNGSKVWEDPPRGFSDPSKVFYAPRVEVLDAQLRSVVPN